MPIQFDKSSGIFHLFSEKSSYIFQLTAENDLLHLYWGRRLRSSRVGSLYRPCLRAFSPNTHPENLDLSFDTLPLEYAFFGCGDFRSPSFQVRYEDGSTLTRLKYISHSVQPGKPKLNGLPATYTDHDNEADTLSILLSDEFSNIEVTLLYTILAKYDVVTRTVRIANRSQNTVMVNKAMSCSVAFHDCNFEMIQLSGSWIRERHLHCSELRPGIQSIESKRGVSSHMQNPFLVLKRKDATEHHGDVFGFSLVYSGNFLAEVEVDQFSTTRASIGINPFAFSWQLKPDDSFQAPEAILAYADDGLNGLSGIYHRLFRERLCRGKFRDEERPILINNWEATYFDFNEEKLLNIAKSAKELGLELFVLDDGWFGNRNEDTCSLGDWVEDKSKLPDGLKGLADKLHAMGLSFGLWVEPEMVSVESDLYKAHPDWCLHIPGRPRTESRNQLVLDLSRQEVCDWLIDTLKTVFSSAKITYVKWDMNRNLTEVWSQAHPAEKQGEIFHRYVLGLYRVLEELVQAFPDILFESCSGGGGRFDPGMLYYMPQTWTSDNTDAVARLKIQYGTSLAYPPISMGSHVSTVPNHQLQRTTPLLTRLHTAMSGNLGFELDLSSLTKEEKKIIKSQVETYKQIRPVIQFGDFYRLANPAAGNLTSWMFVTHDKSKAVLFFSRVLTEPHAPSVSIKLRGLQADKDYRLADYDLFFQAMGYDEIVPGDVLMYGGFRLTPLIGDFQSNMLIFEAV